MSLRILQVVASLDPINGGPPTVVLRLAAALAREGVELVIAKYTWPVVARQM